MHTVVMPKLGLIMTEGTVTEWYRDEGDTVKEGEPLFQIETQKLQNDIEAPVSGVLSKIIAKIGETVPCLEPVAEIRENDSSD